MAEAWACGACGQRVTGQASHCRGGKYGGCCRTFTGDSAFDAHRTGSHHPDERRCLTDEEMAQPPWRQTRRGWTNSNPDKFAAFAERGHPQ